MEETIRQDGKLEQLEARTDSYLAENPDEIFREYLQNLKGRIKAQKNQAELLQAELDRSHEMYLKRMELNRQCEQVRPTQVPPQQDNAQESREQNMQEQTAQETADTFAEENPQYINYHEVQPVKSVEKKTTGGAEYMVGAAILSVVGGAFILTALVMLGVYFMNGFVKGMCLYAGAILLLLVSELVIHKRWPKLATVFTAISIGGLYLFTVINYLSLHNFGMQVAVVITLLITILVVLLSRKRDSLVYRILALVASYLCLLTVKEDITYVEVLVLIGMILLINVLCVCLPLRRHQTAFHAVHLCTNMIFAFAMNLRLDNCGITVEYRMPLVVGLVFIMQLVLLAQMRYQTKEESAGNRVDSFAVKVFYGIASVAYCAILGLSLENLEGMELTRYGSLAAIGVICIAAIFVLRNYSVKWYPYYLVNLAALSLCSGVEEEWVPVICLTVLLAIAKLLSLWRIPALKLSDAVLTTLACIVLLGTMDEKEWYSYVLLAGVMVSVGFISQWQTYFEIILTYTLGFYAVFHLENILQLPVFVGLLFVGILLFNNVPRFRTGSIVVYNGMALAGQVICFLLLMNPVYRDAYITYLCMLVFGLGTIVLTFQEKYHMNFKGKHLIMAIFLTYMALVVRTSLPVMNSILLMLIALVCVGTGFYTKEKRVRIYGLVLSLLVCGKIVLYDYRGAATLQKMILFLTVGIIALIIAGIYIVLEKKNSKAES